MTIDPQKYALMQEVAHAVEKNFVSFLRPPEVLL